MELTKQQIEQIQQQHPDWDNARLSKAITDAGYTAPKVGFLSQMFHGTKEGVRDITAGLAGSDWFTASSGIDEVNAQNLELSKNVIEQIQRYRAEGKDTTRLMKILSDVDGMITGNELTGTEDVLGKTKGQVVGELGQLVLDTTMVGKLGAGLAKVGGAAAKGVAGRLTGSAASEVAKEGVKNTFVKKTLGEGLEKVAWDTGKQLARNVPEGYLYDVSSNLQQKSEAPLSPGLATGVSTAIPLIGGAFRGANQVFAHIARPSRQINQVLGAKIKDVGPNKNPGNAIIMDLIEDGKTKGMGPDEFAAYVKEKAGYWGKQVANSTDDVMKKSGGKADISFADSVKTINSAIEQAQKANAKPAVISELKRIREVITGTTKQTKAYSKLTFKDAAAIQDLIGAQSSFGDKAGSDVSKYADDTVKRVYAEMAEILSKYADDVAPEANWGRANYSSASYSVAKKLAKSLPFRGEVRPFAGMAGTLAIFQAVSSIASGGVALSAGAGPFGAIGAALAMFVGLKGAQAVMSSPTANTKMAILMARIIQQNPSAWNELVSKNPELANAARQSMNAFLSRGGEQ